MYEPIELEIFNQLLSSIPEEMGSILQYSSYSPNIKERKDFSCAVFDEKGQLLAQAAHIPVHLGAMPYSVKSVLYSKKLIEGDIVILNDPFQGGTHLPDITMVAPVYTNNDLIGYVANRAHHSDIGGMVPGSMPLSTEIFQEGLIIPPVYLKKNGLLQNDVYDIILSNCRTPRERKGDINAQLASIERGIIRFKELFKRYTYKDFFQKKEAILNYSERIIRTNLKELEGKSAEFVDYLDDDGIDEKPIKIKVQIKIKDNNLFIDFTGTSKMVKGCVNVVEAVTVSAVHFVILSLFGENVPHNFGCFKPIKVKIPSPSLLAATFPYAVAGGNVETSQRIVDTLFGAFSKIIPDKVPAASSGTMNNISFGGYDPYRNTYFSYYETIAGGMGARPNKDGLSAVQTNMTNTLNTPVEAIEFQFPIRIISYSIRKNSGGSGKYKGGDGIIRIYKALSNMNASILSDRRKFSPYGLFGGKKAKKGKNILLRKNGKTINLKSKCNFKLNKGDKLIIMTPGGGGWGS